MATYTIVSQRETTMTTPDGRFVPAVQVTFETSDGVTASVMVPVAQYTYDYVQQVVADYAARLSQVQGSSGQIPTGP